jgi:hypothetical protein
MAENEYTIDYAGARGSNAGDELGLIRFGGHLLKGRYDVHNGRDTEPAPTSAVR